MVVYVTCRVPVKVELEIDTGEIINVHVIDEKLEGPLGVFNYELVPVGGRLREQALKLVEEIEWSGVSEDRPVSKCLSKPQPQLLFQHRREEQMSQLPRASGLTAAMKSAARPR